MFENLSLLQMARKRMDWIAQRQEVLAENIANANTPHYQAKDLKPLSFRDMVQAPAQVTQVATNPAHIVTAPPADPTQSEVVRLPYESAPDGNSVVLEEQMHKLGEAKSAYETAANLVQKNIKMIRTALGRSGG